MESSYSFTIEAHDLGERLSNNHRCVASAHELSDNCAILAEIARDKTLIGGVKERHLTLFLHKVTDFFPLFRSGIYTSRIMRAGME